MRGKIPSRLTNDLGKKQRQAMTERLRGKSHVNCPTCGTEMTPGHVHQFGAPTGEIDLSVPDKTHLPGDREIGRVVKGPPELLGQTVEKVYMDDRSVIVQFYLSILAACIEGVGSGVHLRASINRIGDPFPDCVLTASIIDEARAVFERDMQNPEYRTKYGLPSPVNESDRREFNETLKKYLVAMFYTQLRRARIFELQSNDFTLAYRLADELTTTACGYEFSLEQNPGPREEIAKVAEYTVNEGEHLAFPERLPFSSCYLAWGTGAPLADSHDELYGLTPGHFNQLMATLVSDNGWVWSVVLKGSKDAAQFAFSRSGAIVGGVKHGIILERIGEQQANDGSSPHLHHPDQPPLLRCQWTLPYALTPWIVNYTVEAIERNDSLTRVQGSSLKERMNYKALSKRSRQQFTPAPYYTVEIRPTTYDEIKTRILSQPREWSHRWDVIGCYNHRIERGLLPLDPKKVHELHKRKYEIYHAMHKPTGEALAFFMRRREPLPREGEYLALLRWWRKPHIKGPENKPYVPSVHKLRGGIDEQ